MNPPPTDSAMATPITQQCRSSSPSQTRSVEELLPQSCALVAESLYASCSVLEAVVEDMCGRYSQFREIAFHEFLRQKALGIRSDESALQSRSEEYVSGFNQVVALGQTSATRCVEEVRARPDTKHIVIEARKLDNEIEEILRKASDCMSPDEGIAGSRKRPFSIFSAHKNSQAFRTSELSLTPAVHRSLANSRDSFFRPSFQQDVSKLKMTPVLATAASIFRKEISATRLRGSSALIRNIPSLPSDHPLENISMLEKDEECDEEESSESNDSQSENDDEVGGEEDEIEIRPSVESSAPRKQTNDTDEEPDAEMTSPLSARPSEWADATGDLATEEEEDNILRETLGAEEEASSDGRESCPLEDDLMELNQDEIPVEALGHSLPPSLPPIAEEPKSEPMQPHLQPPQLKTPGTSPANYSLFKSPFLRLQKKLGVASLFGSAVEEAPMPHTEVETVPTPPPPPKEIATEVINVTPHFPQDENIPPVTATKSYHRFLRKLPPKRVEDNVPFPDGASGNEDSHRASVEWARGGAWMHMVKSQKDINPYKIFGCGIRVVTFDAVFQTPDLRRAAHQAATELRSTRARKDGPMSKDSRVRRWNNDRMTCGFSETEGMSKVQLDRMLELLKKPRDVSDRAYEDWTECEPECNHDRGREQPWFKEVQLEDVQF